MSSDAVIIIPAYNEEKSISKVVFSIRENYAEIDIVVINMDL
tara:strand:- start:633 stop:758 length:126 start_codon:yes stop_codon:yes gene_type:complete